MLIIWSLLVEGIHKELARTQSLKANLQEQKFPAFPLSKAAYPEAVTVPALALSTLPKEPRQVHVNRAVSGDK